MQIVHVEKDVAGHPTDGVVRHLGEDGVPQLVEERGARPRRPIWKNEKKIIKIVKKLFKLLKMLKKY